MEAHLNVWQNETDFVGPLKEVHHMSQKMPIVQILIGMFEAMCFTCIVIAVAAGLERRRLPLAAGPTSCQMKATTNRCLTECLSRDLAPANGSSRSPILPIHVHVTCVHMHAGELEAQLAFWRRQLAYAPPLLSLPLDYPRQAPNEAGEAKSVPLVLPAGLVTQLKNVANASGVSPFMALLAVWQVSCCTPIVLLLSVLLVLSAGSC